MHVFFTSIRHFLAAGPLTGTDHHIAAWFGHHLSGWLVHLMLAFSQPGSAACIAVVLSLLTAYLLWRRHWHRLVSLILIVPGGLLLNSAIKILVHRHRPIIPAPFPHWDGYSFPSGHTIGATLLYGMILLALLPLMRRRRWKALACGFGALLVLLVGFSRIALGAHYLTDVVGAVLLGSTWLGLCSAFLAVVARYRRPCPPAICRIEPEKESTELPPRKAA
ncbi:MAG TPA: phosphatase PAP2 family protein [Tepidisphaeraceae bacterium]|jgi:undecaprenyl-diphosphatase|nr:phosphatase PAP2 family protein [Tepidisphaeraceae bacterium]